MDLQFYQCGVGESISLMITTNSQKYNFLLDSGFKAHYKLYTLPFLVDHSKVKFWILTHTDEDHIGGIIKMLEIGDEDLLKEKVDQIWFNWSSLEYKPPNDEISVRQGMLLRDKLHELDKLHETDITTKTPQVNIDDIAIHILSPSPAKLEKSKVKWRKEEQKKIAAKSDYHFTIEELLKHDFTEDTSVWNGGSIAVLIESEGKRVMLLADAHPSVIVETLKRDKFGCTPESPLKVDCVKVSHHGSKANTSFELLELIDCQDWVFCANGTKHGFPHKECIARIIHQRKDEEEPTRILFNQNRPTYKEVFGVDENAKERYNFDLFHLDQGKYEI